MSEPFERGVRDGITTATIPIERFWELVDFAHQLAALRSQLSATQEQCERRRASENVALNECGAFREALANAGVAETPEGVYQLETRIKELEHVADGVAAERDQLRAKVEELSAGGSEGHMLDQHIAQIEADRDQLRERVKVLTEALTWLRDAAKQVEWMSPACVVERTEDALAEPAKGEGSQLTVEDFQRLSEDET